MEYDVPFEEQETHAWIDYMDRKVKIYTSRKTVYRKLEKKLGKPTEISTEKGKIVGGRWDINFKDKKLISSVLNRSLLVGGFA